MKRFDFIVNLLVFVVQKARFYRLKQPYVLMWSLFNQDLTEVSSDDVLCGRCLPTI